MAKRAGGFGLVLPARPPGAQAQSWLSGALRTAILHGRLRPGARLPSTRELAAQYRVSRGTVVAVFAQLTSEGYLAGKIGSGTYVAPALPDELLQVAAHTAAAPPLRPPRRRLSHYGKHVVGFPQLAPSPGRAFRANVPALDQFPTTLWAQLASRRLRLASAKLLLGCDPAGYLPLRAALTGYLATARGVSCRPEQVFIVSGVQEALDVVARLIIDPGDRACIEEPGYRAALRLLEAVGARVAAIPVDSDGMQLPPPRMRAARLVYLTPAHQCPLGVAMTLPRRLALLAWARRTGALLFEDDYDSEYRYANPPLPALQGLDRSGHVVFASSFSKVLFPSLRLGYLVVPPDLVDRVTAARSLTQRHPPMLEQMIVCDFIAEGHLGRHIRRMRQLYAERLAVLTEAARHQLAGLLALSPIEAGLSTIGWLPAGITGAAVEDVAHARNIELVSLHRFYISTLPRDGLQLGFAAVDPRELRRGVSELAGILERLAASAASTSTRQRRRS